MSLHVAVSGWLLGDPSGANRRLLSLLARCGPLLSADERITVLHRPDFEPPALPRVHWLPLAIPAQPTWRRVAAERRLLRGCLASLRADLLDHAFLPLPRVPLPVCLTLHDLRAAEGLTRWPRWFAVMALRSACARAAALVVPSRFTADRLRHFAPQAPHATVIHNGIELPAPAPLPTAAPGYLLHVGHLEPRKNLAVVLRALAQLPAARRPELRLAGRDAGDLPALRRLADRLGIGTSVHPLGVVADRDLPALYAGARAVVAPSRYEGFGLTALDGLAHGRPVLAAAAGALPEVVDGQGMLLGPDDAAAWARAIDATASDLEGAAARRRQRAATFGWAAPAEALLATWRSAAGGRPADGTRTG